MCGVNRLGLLSSCIRKGGWERDSLARAEEIAKKRRRVFNVT